MSFHKMAFSLKEADVMADVITPPTKFIYSVTKNDKVNNWSQKFIQLHLILISNILKEK